MNRSHQGLVHMAMAAGAYAASAPVLAHALSLGGAHCSYSMMQTHCSLGSGPAVYDPAIYGAIALSMITMFAATRLWAHDRPWYPLVATFTALALGVMAYDTMLGLDVVDGEKLANDTFNTLRFAVLASFLLLFRMMRGMNASTIGAAAAIVASYAAVIVAAIAFHHLANGLIGSTKLFVLFMLYAFGGFGTHIMAICMLFSSARLVGEHAESVAIVAEPSR